MCIKVIGIDPAPSKKSTVYSEKDGFKSFDANELKKYLQKLKDSEESVLICWDAPLTGPRNPDAEQILPGDYTQRQIESFFKRQQGMKTPTGISVLGYASCPHWAITRAMLGLPRVGCYDQRGNLPFQLLALDCERKVLDKLGEKCVVEVHPAVALWLWLKAISDIEDTFKEKGWMKKVKNKVNKVMDWTYKYDKKEHEELQREKITFFCKSLEGVIFNDIIKKSLIEAIKKIENPEELPPNSKLDDIFDAMLAWLLGKLWLVNGGVTLLGSKETGAILLPYNINLTQRWEKFKSSGTTIIPTNGDNFKVY